MLGSRALDELVWGIAAAIFVLLLLYLLWSFFRNPENPLFRPLGMDGEPSNHECLRYCSKGDRETVTRVIRFAYLATLLAVLLALLPPVLLSKSEILRDFFRDSAIGIVLGCQAEANGFVTACGGDGGVEAPGEWVLNIGGMAVTPAGANVSASSGPVRLNGGLVVPLYLIVISLLGACVGMARRLPEFQRRSSQVYVDRYLTDAKAGVLAEGAPEPMDAARVREVVVFQVLQVFSSPLVAITAYFLLDPEHTASVVLIAFASGFSTEAVLLLIRRGVDRVGRGSQPEKSGGFTGPVVEPERPRQDNDT